MQIVLSPITRFLRTERASMSIELVLILPLLLWAYFGMFILFEGYRSLAANVRAAYTVSDLLSREVNAVDADYIDGMNDVVDLLTQSPHRTVLRVTVARYREDDDEHELVWSDSSDGIDPISDGNFNNDIVPHLPPMPDASVMVIVETWMAFVPFINMGIDPFYFESLVTIRPRFSGQLCYEVSSTTMLC